MLTTLIDVLAVIGAATVITAVALVIVFLIYDQDNSEDDDL